MMFKLYSENQEFLEGQLKLDAFIEEKNILHYTKEVEGKIQEIAHELTNSNNGFLHEYRFFLKTRLRRSALEAIQEQQKQDKKKKELIKNRIDLLIAQGKAKGSICQELGINGKEYDKIIKVVVMK